MADYKAMYHSLFNALTDAIELLKKAQEEGERLFIEGEEKPSLKKIDSTYETYAGVRKCADAFPAIVVLSTTQNRKDIT